MKACSVVFTIFPLLTLSLVVFSLLNLISGMNAGWVEGVVYPLQLVSGDTWRVTFGDIFLVGSTGLLFVELLRATRTGTDSLFNHAFSVILFIVSLLLFVLVPGYGNSVFFLFLAMTFLDFMAGFIVTTMAARRDLAMAYPGSSN